MCRVVNKNREEWDVHIGRGSLWGNPFVCGTREEVIEKYRVRLDFGIDTGRITLKQLAALDGKRLGCTCKPKPCHGDVLVERVRWAVEQLRGQI